MIHAVGLTPHKNSQIKNWTFHCQSITAVLKISSLKRQADIIYSYSPGHRNMLHKSLLYHTVSGTIRVGRYQKKHSPTHTHEKNEEGFTQTTRSTVDMIHYSIIMYAQNF